MIFSSAVLLLAAASSCGVFCVELTQPSSMVVKPQGSFSISCRISESSYCIHWIRQPAGKALEWLGYICNGGSINIKDSVKNKISFTQDTSKNTVFLQGNSFQTEDTAVYYCARQWRAGVGTYFDYWGKGTQVTVTNDELKAPVVYKMSQCNATDPQMFGCVASEFSPAESFSFKWTDQNGKALTDFVQHPTVKTAKGENLKVSYITISREKMGNNIKCESVHPLKTETKIFSKAEQLTVSLIPVPTQNSTYVMCVIENFHSKDITVQWKLNNHIMEQKTKMEYKQTEDTGPYIALNFYKVSSETWNKNTDYTCEVTHMGQVQSVTKNFKATLTLTLKTPIQRELFLNNKVILQAVVSGNERKSVEDASVSCKMENEALTLQKVILSQKDTPDHQKFHNVIVDPEKWFAGKRVTCSIRDKDIKDEIYFNKGDAKTPGVTLYEQNVYNTDPAHISLVCEVTSSKLGDVYIMWRVDDGEFKEGSISAPIHRDDSTSVISIFKVSKETYRKNTKISCAVKHANMDKGQTPKIETTSPSKSKCPECPACSRDY